MTLPIEGRFHGFSFTVTGKHCLVRMRDDCFDAPVEIAIQIPVERAIKNRVPPRVRRALIELVAATIEFGARNGTLAGDLEALQGCIDFTSGEP